MVFTIMAALAQMELEIKRESANRRVGAGSPITRTAMVQRCSCASAGPRPRRSCSGLDRCLTIARSQTRQASGYQRFHCLWRCLCTEFGRGHPWRGSPTTSDPSRGPEGVERSHRLQAQDLRLVQPMVLIGEPWLGPLQPVSAMSCGLQVSPWVCNPGCLWLRGPGEVCQGPGCEACRLRWKQCSGQRRLLRQPASCERVLSAMHHFLREPRTADGPALCSSRRFVQGLAALDEMKLTGIGAQNC